jgi:lipopolysaccharide/colanic/teichoic acid biosynthesis glycosyltransferase
MKLNNLIKYFFRFILLQTILTSLTILYFDNFLISSQEFKQNIYENLVEDAERFIPFISYELITVDSFFTFMIFFFLIILYSTKFYTYVNELSFSINRNLLDEYFQIYLLWTSYLFGCFYLFRFENVSRGYLFLFSLIVPFVLLIFRNPEFLSSILGRSVTNETYLTINLDKNSNFRNLRIITFRKDLGNFKLDLHNSNKIIEKIDELNKSEKVNLIVLNLETTIQMNEQLEDYLIETNKKVLLISANKPEFDKSFIFRQEILDQTYFTYFNNDIQYGAKYIIKRFMDITLSILGLIIFFPIMVVVGLYIVFLDGFPFYIKQSRVGLHGDIFSMFKFRTMRLNSHELRDSLDELNQSDGPLFKIENDPRIINRLEFVRKYSLDELLQFFNVLRGDMSIVGPRPLFDDDTQLFDTKYMRRLNVLPGITGLLQINDRNTSEFETWYKYDIEYIENWSLYLDIKIILKTPFAIFSKKIRGL